MLPFETKYKFENGHNIYITFSEPFFKTIDDLKIETYELI